MRHCALATLTLLVVPAVLYACGSEDAADDPGEGPERSRGTDQQEAGGSGGEETVPDDDAGADASTEMTVPDGAVPALDAGNRAALNRLVAPWTPGTRVSIGQGPRGAFTHQKMLGAFDIGMAGGTSYLSVGLGIVTEIKTNCPSGTVNVNPDRRCGQGYGNHVIIRHLEVGADGVEKPRLSKSGKIVHSVYGHMNKVLVTVGQRVVPSTPLGTCGLTGYTTGYHMHFQFQNGPTPLLVDPNQIGYKDATRDKGLEGAIPTMLTNYPY